MKHSSLNDGKVYIMERRRDCHLDWSKTSIPHWSIGSQLELWLADKNVAGWLALLHCKLCKSSMCDFVTGVGGLHNHAHALQSTMETKYHSPIKYHINLLSIERWLRMSQFFDWNFYIFCHWWRHQSDAIYIIKYHKCCWLLFSFPWFTCIHLSYPCSLVHTFHNEISIINLKIKTEDTIEN